MHIDRRLRGLTITATVLVAVAVAILAVLSGSAALMFVAAALWGWDGVPTLLQTAAAIAGGEASDTAQGSNAGGLRGARFLSPGCDAFSLMPLLNRRVQFIGGNHTICGPVRISHRL